MAARSSPPAASICIVTFRRAEGLARLLRSVERLKRPEDFGFEVVIVDNDPHSEASGGPELQGIPLRRFRQSRNRIAAARDRAVREARGEWVAFVDDDEELCEDWLIAHWRACERNPLADGFLGPVVPRFERPGPAWLDLATFYGRAPQHHDQPVDPLRSYTANAWLRRRLFDAVHFEGAFDRTLGEDVDLFLRLHARGARILWCDDARVIEWISPHRQRAGWLLRRGLESGGAHAELLRRHSAVPRSQHVARSLGAALALVAVLPVAALAGRRSLVRAARRLCVQLGRLSGFAGRQLEREGR